MVGDRGAYIGSGSDCGISGMEQKAVMLDKVEKNGCAGVLYISRIEANKSTEDQYLCLHARYGMSRRFLCRVEARGMECRCDALPPLGSVYINEQLLKPSFRPRSACPW